MDELRVRQRTEQKELQSRIQSIKKEINTSDKKRKKEIAAEIASLKEELDLRHAQELLSLSSVDQLANQMTKANIDEVGENGFKYQVKELSKAQRKKEKKKQSERKRQELIEEEDVSHLTQSKRREDHKLATALSSRNLVVYDIPSDGDCLYNSIKDQLSRRGIQVSVTELREKASKYMLQHRDLFQPFMSTDDMMSDVDFESYCHTVANTKEWGGSLELRALSEALGFRMEVIQADGPVIEFGSQFDKDSTLLISYHRHAYSLGEHYNSLVCKASLM